MADLEAPPEPDGGNTLERLRDRTDELELIISSLTLVALFTLPGWLYGQFAAVYTHLPLTLVITALVVTTLLAGVSYGLASCFLVHLMARAYWVGLIGLRTVFPNGIDWGRTPTLGPHSQRYYQKRLPDLAAVIESTDKLASSLFAVISMLTLTVLWIGAIQVVTLVVAGVIGARFGVTNAALGAATLLLLGAFIGIPLLIYLLDRQLAARLPWLADSRVFAALIGVLRRTAGIAIPERLVLPVQLTLQSNTRPFAFFVALILGVVAMVAIGSVRASAWQNFTLSNEFSYLDGQTVAAGFRSTYYEDMPSRLDGIRAWPRISSFEQNGSFMTVFLPYQPLRDNLVLERLCGPAPETPDTVGCLRQLWSVQIDGEPVPMADFIAAERSDLNMRGLIGLVQLVGREPGLHNLVVTWNPQASADAEPIDDRYTEARVSFDIPVAYMPDVELPATH